MQHCWVRLSVCGGAYLYSTCASVAVCVCVGVNIQMGMCIFVPMSLWECVCMHMRASSLAYICCACVYVCMYHSLSCLPLRLTLPLIGEAHWQTQHHTLRDSLSAG